MPLPHAADDERIITSLQQPLIAPSNLSNRNVPHSLHSLFLSFTVEFDTSLVRVRCSLASELLCTTISDLTGPFCSITG
jgi:hypothetical protein